MKKLIYVAFLCASLVFASDAQEKIDPKVVNELSTPILSGDMVQESIDNYAQKKGIEFGALNNGRIYFSSISHIPVNPTNSQWGKYRSLAYEKAIMNAQKEFTKFMYQKITSDTYQKFYNDESNNAKVIKKEDTKPHTKLGEIFTKLGTLVGAHLDKALEELDIDPSEFNAVPKDKRKVYFEGKMRKQIVSKSIGSLSGILPIQTIEGKDKNGGYSLGVIILYSDKLKQLAYDITKRKLPLLTKKSGKKASAFIPSSNDALLATFGPRVVFLEDGTPGVLSYAQWSHNYTGKKQVKLQRRRDAALKTATQLADAQIAEFLSAKMSSTEEKIIEQVSQEAVKRSGETGDVFDDDVENLLDITSEESKKRAKAKLQGVIPVKKWRVKLDSGHEVVGVIRLWSYAGSQQAQNIKNFKPKHNKSSTVANAKVTNGSAVTRQGADVMDVNDF